MHHTRCLTSDVGKLCIQHNLPLLICRTSGDLMIALIGCVIHNVVVQVETYWTIALIGCVVQNVLIQMGLHVVSVDGMLIRRTQTKILRCYGCFKYVEYFINFVDMSSMRLINNIINIIKYNYLIINNKKSNVDIFTLDTAYSGGISSSYPM